MGKSSLLVVAVILLAACTPGETGVSSGADDISGAVSIAQASFSAEDGSGENILQCLYYERDLFMSGMADPCDYRDERRLVSGIVPHHLLASDMLSGFFTLAAQHTYDTVVILAPSHYPEQCGSYVVTSDRDWNTPFGVVETDADLVEMLLKDGTVAAENNPGALEYDHGGAGLVPYVAHYLPDAKVVVCLVSVQTSEKRMDILQQMIFKYAETSDVLFVASADFSHYQQPEEAAVYDDYTERSIAAFDYETISRYSSKNVDSPQALMAFMRSTEYFEAELIQLDHSSSAEKIVAGISNPIFAEGITTYFVYAGFADV